MPRQKVLLTVTTYPLPSRSYEELVCTAGVLEDGSWIRIYPVPLSFLMELKKGGRVAVRKYTWMELELVKRVDDFRPESHSPRHYDFRDVEILGHIDTRNNWMHRKRFCLKNVYTSIIKLIGDSRAPHNVSLATFKPQEIVGFEVEEDERDWKPVWQQMRQQLPLFPPEGVPDVSSMIPKVPFKFYYRFKDSEGKTPRLIIEDWEIGSLYWKCLRDYGDENVALEKVKERYFDDIAKTKDIHLFLGTTSEGHRRRWPNPFVIIGVFYPKIDNQMQLF